MAPYGRFFQEANVGLQKAFAEATLLHLKTIANEGGSDYVYMDAEFRRKGVVIYKTDFTVDKDGMVMQ